MIKQQLLIVCVAKLGGMTFNSDIRFYSQDIFYSPADDIVKS